MRIASIVGARPQFVKLAMVSRALAVLRASGKALDQVVIHTGQHYDVSMSEIFFEDFELPPPALNLGVGSGPHGEQTGKMLQALEKAFAQLEPDVVIVFGDTNSTLAGALAAAKMGLPVAHVEAGLRSFNRAMPEEINRVATDHVCNRLFAPTEQALHHLQSERLGARSELVGDVMADAVLFNVVRARESSVVLGQLGLPRHSYALATIHRAESTTRGVLPGLLDALAGAADMVGRIIVPLHPRTAQAIRDIRPGWHPSDRLVLIDPVGYLDMLALIDSARLVLTDSGGLQKEAFLLGTPCVTMRSETEWTESVQAGANLVAGTSTVGILAAVERVLSTPEQSNFIKARALECYGGGQAGGRIADAVLNYLSW